MKTRKNSRSPILPALAALVIGALIVAQARAASFSSTGSLNTNRQSHTATLLPGGKVLVAGGCSGTNYFSSAELFDPTTGTWAATGAMTTNRTGHTATLLLNGKVLVAGGDKGGGSYGSSFLGSAELYDPATGAWSPTGSLPMPCAYHTATLLRDGKVLVAGMSGSLTGAALYDPATGAWTATGSLHYARDYHTATLLPNGKVLVAGGKDGTYSHIAELYDPGTGAWTTTGTMNTFHYSHTATLLPDGKVLVAAGIFNGSALAGAEVYDPAVGIWTSVGALTTARYLHTATLLPSGKVMVAGGYKDNIFCLSSAELYDPATGTWTSAGTLVTDRRSHTATLLPGGSVLISGGYAAGGASTKAELCDLFDGTSASAGSLATPRFDHTATWLTNGLVLVAGGHQAGGVTFTSAELYNPAAGTWTASGAMQISRVFHTATLLPNGKVLAAGGGYGLYFSSSTTATVELYNPATGTWTRTGNMNTPRDVHTATLLPTGKVLVTGGFSGSDYLSNAELYDPATGTWQATQPMAAIRSFHTATLLANGKVLVAGGFSPSSYLASAELYDPASGMWTPTGSLHTLRQNHTATLLPNGKVLVAGGLNNSAELYDPAAGTWATIGSMAVGRAHHRAVLLSNGKVLVIGGQGAGAPYNGSFLSSVELCDPIAGTWTATGWLIDARSGHTVTPLPNGRLLAVGGWGYASGNSGSSAVLASAELYDLGLGIAASSRPQIATMTSPLVPGASLSLTGSGFRGVSEGSGGNCQGSPADFPLVQLRSLESGQSMFLRSANWQTNAFTSLPVWGFPPGYAMATVFVNGIPSTGSVFRVTAPIPIIPIGAAFQKLPNGTVQLAFTNTPGALFGVLATTNPGLPLGSWTPLGSATEVAPGQFQFVDLQATSSPVRFYRVVAP